jgi:hypothetical protein
MIAPLRSAAIAAALSCSAAAAHTSAAHTSDSASRMLASWSIAQPSPARSPEWGSASDFEPDDGYLCPFTADPGYLEGGGGDSQVIQDNGHAYMGCGGGPTISLEQIEGDTVTFALHGDRISVREGATERLGPYRVHVVSVRGQRVELELSDPD